MRKSSAHVRREPEHNVNVLAHPAVKPKPVKSEKSATPFVELFRVAQLESDQELLRQMTDGISSEMLSERLATHIVEVAAQLLSPPRSIKAGGLPIEVDREQLVCRVLEFELAFVELARVDMLPAPGRVTALTENEESVLTSGGFDLSALPPDAIDPVSRATAEFARLVSDSYKTEEAARILGVNTSRVRQRVAGTQRTLFGFKLGDEWRIPKFQFSGKRVVAGLDHVIEKLPSNLHPVAVYRWFTTPNPDLSLSEDVETPVSPLDWLKMGNPPDAVAELATNL